MLEISLLLNNWSFHPEAWLILGILLVLSDLVLGMNYFLLPLGIAAFLTAVLVALGNSLISDEVLMGESWMTSVLIFESWKDLFYWFAGLSVLCTISLRFFFRKAHAETDINDY